MSESDHAHEKPASDTVLPAVSRSFPVPRKKPAAGENEDAGVELESSTWGLRALLAAAVVMAGAAVWIKFGSDGKHYPETRKADPGTVVPEQPRVVSGDPAIDIYFTASTPSQEEHREAAVQLPQVGAVAGQRSQRESPVRENPPAPAEGEGIFDLFNDPPSAPEHREIAAVQPAPLESPAAPPKAAPRPADPPGELELRYIAALDDARNRAPSDAEPQFVAEVERVKKGEPVPPPRPGLHRELHRLQCIYRREKTKEALPPPPPPEAREIEVYLMGGAPVTLLLNGEEVVMLKSKSLSSDSESFETQQAILTVLPGDVLGFHCCEQSVQRYFGMAARSGRSRLFGSDKRWEATVKPDAAWWKGGGAATHKPKVQSNEIDYPAAAARGFQHYADTRFTDYDIIWTGAGPEAAFRYVLRAADLPKKAPDR